MNTIDFTKLALKLIIAYLYCIYLSVARFTVNICVAFFEKTDLYNYREQCLP